MQYKRKNLFCMFMVLILFISGICFKDCSIDDFFAYTVSNETSSQLSNVEAVICDAQLCTTQMLGIRSDIVGGQQTLRYGTQGKSAKLLLDDLSEDIISKKTGNSFSFVGEVNLFYARQSNLVTVYIHKSDGKKRI